MYHIREKWNIVAKKKKNTYWLGQVVDVPLHCRTTIRSLATTLDVNPTSVQMCKRKYTMRARYLQLPQYEAVNYSVQSFYGLW